MIARRIAGCVFCEADEHVRWKGEQFLIVADPAPILAGHVLVVPREHHPSAGDIPAPLRPELERVHATLRSAYMEVLGAWSMFEHGRTGHCVRVGVDEHLCEHAHLHHLPTDVDISGALGLHQRSQIRDWSEVQVLSRTADGYALTGGERSTVFHPVTHALPPHHIRTVLSTELGVPERSDWQAMRSTMPDALRAEHEDAVARVIERFERIWSGADA